MTEKKLTEAGAKYGGWEAGCALAARLNETDGHTDLSVEERQAWWDAAVKGFTDRGIVDMRSARQVFAEIEAEQIAAALDGEEVAAEAASASGQPMTAEERQAYNRGHSDGWHAAAAGNYTCRHHRDTPYGKGWWDGNEAYRRANGIRPTGGGRAPAPAPEADTGRTEAAESDLEREVWAQCTPADGVDGPGPAEHDPTDDLHEAAFPKFAAEEVAANFQRAADALVADTRYGPDGITHPALDAARKEGYEEGWRDRAVHESDGFSAGWNSGWDAAKRQTHPEWEREMRKAVWSGYKHGRQVGRKLQEGEHAKERARYEESAALEQMQVVARLRERHGKDIESLCADLRAEYEHKLAAQEERAALEAERLKTEHAEAIAEARADGYVDGATDWPEEEPGAGVPISPWAAGWIRSSAAVPPAEATLEEKAEWWAEFRRGISDRRRSDEAAAARQAGNGFDNQTTME